MRTRSPDLSDDLVKFKRDHGVLFNEKERGDINVERFKSLSQALMDAQLESTKAKLAFDEGFRSIANDPAKVKAVEKYRGLGAVSATEEQLLRSELFRWQTQLGDLQKQFLPNHPTVRSTQKRVDELSIAYVATLERRWRSNEELTKELTTKFEQQRDATINRKRRRRHICSPRAECEDERGAASDGRQADSRSEPVRGRVSRR